MRVVLLIVTLLFLAGLLFLTIYDISHNGVTPLDVVAIILIAFFGVALIGALTYRGPEPEGLADLEGGRADAGDFR